MTEQLHDWSEADTLVKTILPVITKYFTQVTVCGSYRRNATKVSDLDIVCLGIREGAPTYRADKPKYLYRKLGAPETPFDALLVELEVGNQQLSKRSASRVMFSLGFFKVDISLATSENYGALVLFSTGSVAFNSGMRDWTSNKGLVLTKDGLFDQENKYLAGSTEQSIFTYLGLSYADPQNRTEFAA